MRILIIGGTRFLGRHIVEAARSQGHELTLFHRGQSNPRLFEGVEEVFGDRDGEIEKLQGHWDAVVDTCGYFPRIVRQSVEHLRDRVGLYCFISTVSVYDEGESPLKEESPVLRFETAPELEEITGESYGRFKVLCEEEVQSGFGERALILRPGLIVGPHDPTDRFTYWIDRFLGSGEVLLPERRDQPIQLVDVRDLAQFTVRLLESGVGGTFNVTGPRSDLSMGELWDLCESNCGGDATPVLAPQVFLQQEGVQPWQDLPFTVPPEDSFPVALISPAMDAGLQLRPLAETIRATADWHRGRQPVELKTGLSREREAELITKLRAGLQEG